MRKEGVKSHLRINGEATREEKAKAYALALERFQVAERERFQSNSAMETFKAARKDLLKKAVIAANELLRAVEELTKGAKDGGH